MRIAYLVHLNLDDLTGVFKKIVNQTRVWESLGHTVRLFIVTRNTRVAQSIRDAVSNPNVSLYQPKSIKGRLHAFAQAVDSIERFSPDVVYLRRDLFYLPVYKLARSLPVVTEINSEELVELWLHNKAQWLYHLFTRPLLDKRLAGMVFVTRELAMKGYYGRLHLPKLVIGNGIDLEQYPRLPVSGAKTPNLLFVASPSIWHGLDKIVFLARQFPCWIFHMVGLTADDVPEMPENIRLYGRLSLKEYLPIAAQAHVGIGTLALHRKRLNEASPLKVREYLALGLPVIIGYQDTDFTGGEPFICQIPNSEDNVQKSLNKIETFVAQWMGRRVEPELVAHLDYRVKEVKRLEFLESVVRGSKRDV